MTALIMSRAGARAAVQVVDSLQKGHQAMVFVHSRKDTGKTARTMQMKAQQGGDMAHFDCREEEGWHFMQQEIDKSKNRHVLTHRCATSPPHRLGSRDLLPCINAFLLPGLATNSVLVCYQSCIVEVSEHEPCKPALP